MPRKTQEKKNGLCELLKKVWLPIASPIWVVTLLYNFYKLWAGDERIITEIIVGVGLVVILLSLLWVAFSKKIIKVHSKKNTGLPRNLKAYRYSYNYRTVAWVILAIIVICCVIGSRLFLNHRQELEDKLIVVIATFDGPEDVFGLRNEIIEKLNADFVNEKGIEIVTIKDIITPADGSKAAVKLGIPYLADVVIWGWYRPTDNPNISIHIRESCS